MPIGSASKPHSGMRVKRRKGRRGEGWQKEGACVPQQ